MIKKTLKKSLIALVILNLAIILDSCKKDDNDSQPSPTPVDTAVYFDCKLNNVAFVDDAFFADYSGIGTSRIIAQNNDELMRIDFGSETTGTYQFSNSGANTIKYFDINSNEYISTSGSITITKYDKAAKKLSGTFTGTLSKVIGTGTITITEGKFNNITVEPF